MTESCMRCGGQISPKQLRVALRNGRVPKYCSRSCSQTPKETAPEREEEIAAISFRQIGKNLGLSHVTVLADYRNALEKLRSSPELEYLFREFGS